MMRVKYAWLYLGVILGCHLSCGELNPEEKRLRDKNKRLKAENSGMQSQLEDALLAAREADEEAQKSLAAFQDTQASLRDLQLQHQELTLQKAETEKLVEDQKVIAKFIVLKLSESEAAVSQLEALKQTLLKRIEELNADIASKDFEKASLLKELKETEAQLALLEEANTYPAEVIKKLQNELNKNEQALAAQEAEISQLQLQSAQKLSELEDLYAHSLHAYDGIWIMDPRVEIGFPDCQHIVRVDARKGFTYSVLVCADGKIQADLQVISSFHADTSSSWPGRTGFVVNLRESRSSCDGRERWIGKAEKFSFDHGLNASAGEGHFLMKAAIGIEEKVFRSGASFPQLGKNKRCEVILKYADLPSQKDNLLLQTAALACHLTPDLQWGGCFISENEFVGGERRKW